MGVLIKDYGLSVSDIEAMRLGRLMQYVEIFADLAKVRKQSNPR